MKKKVLVITIVLALSMIMVACGKTNIEGESGGSSESGGAIESNGNSVGEFTAETIEGETINEQFFKENKLTILKLWSVNCGACIYEMPEVLKLHKDLPEDMELVTVVTDQDVAKSEIYKLTGSSKEDYKTIYLNNEIWNNFMNNYTMTPTTLFINENGEIIGEHIGVPRSEDISGEYIKMAKGFIK